MPARSATRADRQRRGAQCERCKQRTAGASEAHEDVGAGEAELEVDQRLPSAALGPWVAGHDRGGQMRSAVGALARRGAYPVTGKEIIDGHTQGG